MRKHAVRPGKVADAVADHIQQMILEGSLQAGERLLSERELSVKFNVSRPTLRDALNRLIASNLLVTNAQGVAYVSDAVGKTLRDPLMHLMETAEARTAFVEVRAVIEAVAAGFASERASDLDRDAIRKRFEAMVAAYDSQDIDEIAETDAELHIAIYEASHNLVLLHFMHTMETILRSNVYLNRRNLYEQRTQKESQLAEHRAIYEAIMDRDAPRARAAALRHITIAMQTQREIAEAKRRLEDSIRQLDATDLVAPTKPRRDDT
jgi:GntR family transcriptional repressor for pyruvate dehydrogenase complex